MSYCLTDIVVWFMENASDGKHRVSTTLYLMFPEHDLQHLVQLRILSTRIDFKGRVCYRLRSPKCLTYFPRKASWWRTKAA